MVKSPGLLLSHLLGYKQKSESCELPSQTEGGGLPLPGMEAQVEPGHRFPEGRLPIHPTLNCLVGLLTAILDTLCQALSRRVAVTLSLVASDWASFGQVQGDTESAGSNNACSHYSANQTCPGYVCWLFPFCLFIITLHSSPGVCFPGRGVRVWDISAQPVNHAGLCQACCQKKEDL